MTKKKINRDASDKTKGFYLQKLRAISLFFEQLELNSNSCIFIATEYQGDIYLKSKLVDYTEENKNYTSSNFSFFSKQILNTLVYFLDIWHEAKFDENITFGFYATNKYVKEKKSETVKSFGISTLPDKSIIELMIEKKWEYPFLLGSIRSAIFGEFKSQYKIDLRGDINDNLLIQFLESIDWSFRGIASEDLEKKIVKQIRNCNFFHPVLKKREIILLSRIKYEMDRREISSFFLQKFLNKDIVENIFLKEKNFLFEFSYRTNMDKQRLNLVTITQNSIRTNGESFYLVKEGQKPINNI